MSHLAYNSKPKKQFIAPESSDLTKSMINNSNTAMAQTAIAFQ